MPWAGRTADRTRAIFPGQSGQGFLRLVPDIPAIAETVAGFEAVGFCGIAAPKGTPPEIVAVLNQAVGEALKDPKLLARLAEIGGIARPMTAAEFARLVADETERWRKVVEFAGVSVD